MIRSVLKILYMLCGKWIEKGASVDAERTVRRCPREKCQGAGAQSPGVGGGGEEWLEFSKLDKPG